MFQTLIDRRDRTRIEKLGSGVRKNSGLFVKFGFAITWLIAGRRSANLYLSVTHFGGFVLKWKGSAASLVKYLKTSQILLMQAVSGKPGSECRLLGAVVGQGLQGIPTLIPHRDRIRIVRGDVALIRLWLSLLGCYRVIECRGRASYKTITQPGADIKIPLADFGDFLKTFKTDKLGAALLKKIPVPKLRFTPKAILTSGPNCPPNSGSLWTLAWDARAIWNARNLPWFNAFQDYCLYSMNTKVLGLIRLYAGVSNSYPNLHGDDLLAAASRDAKSVFTRALDMILSLTEREDDEERVKETSFLQLSSWSRYLVLGRLHAIPEPAGKVRVVAMVTWWVQCLLYPLHSELFKRLALIPQDGTHDQRKPLVLLANEVKRMLEATGQAHVYSFDLKAATDRIPIDLQVRLLSDLLGGPLARSWKTILVGIPYHTLRLKARCGRGGAALRYKVGQPMGAYSSWAMLALVHHFLVQFAAYKAGHRGWYPFYAVLGDDIVIVGKAVARRYRETCEALGITIGLAKSLTSSNGTFEFAKKFYYRGEDASPLSVREYWVALGSLPAFVEFVQRAKSVNTLLRLSDALRAYSKGYRVVGKLTAKLADLGNTRAANLLTALFLPGAPFAKPFLSIFSPTSTGIRLDENLVDTPITERRVASASRRLGDSIKEFAGSHAKAAKAFLDEAIVRGLGVSRGRSSRLWAGMMEAGLAPFLSAQRAMAISDRGRELKALSSIGSYLQVGKLNSKGLLILLEKVVPLWTHAMSDVGAMPLPEALVPQFSTLKRAKLHKLLKLRVSLLGLAWRRGPKQRIKEQHHTMKGK